MPQAEKIPYDKPPLKFSDQVVQLQQRGLVINDTQLAEHYLSHLNYYRLAAYFLPFEKDHATHQFKDGTTFDEILNLYIFDRELRLLVLDAIERIEVSLRTQMAYHLSMNHNDTHPHLNENIFRDIARYRKSLKKLVSDVENSNEEFIRHLLAKYTELLPPVWAAVELMTMGQLSNWFSNIRHRRDRQDISKGYGLDERIMTSFCEHLSLVRNCAAHHARLWNREFVKTMMLPKNAPQYLQISLNRTPDNEKKLRKLYNTLTMSAYLMDRINPAHQWKVRLAALIESHGVDTSSMGFPKDWAALPVWRDKDKPQ